MCEKLEEDFCNLHTCHDLRGALADMAMPARRKPSAAVKLAMTERRARGNLCSVRLRTVGSVKTRYDRATRSREPLLGAAKDRRQRQNSQ